MMMETDRIHAVVRGQVTEMPANDGDSIEFRDVTCQHCGSLSTMVIRRHKKDGQLVVRAELKLCCDKSRRLAREYIGKADGEKERV